MGKAAVLSAKKIRGNVVGMLLSQGYRMNNGSISLPEDATKDDFRRMNELAKLHRIAKAEPVYRKHEDRLITYIASGDELSPERVRPRLVRVEGESEEAILFRYATLHWSIPVSSGFGRRLRFLVMDESNGKLIGLFGIGDPVYNIQGRDKWIGWDSKAKRTRLYHVMDAFVLGAVPPYSMLLGGKLVALLSLSNEVRVAFRQRYTDKETLILKEKRPPCLALITTSSALGRSSIYNRIKLNGYEFWRSVGFTQGSGEFHFSNGVYEQIRAFAELKCQSTAKDPSWGRGFRNKREVVKKCLAAIGLSTNLLYHGVHRELFVAPLATNAREFLRGETSQLDPYDWSADSLTERFMERWLLPRAKRVTEYQSFCRDSYRLWPSIT